MNPQTAKVAYEADELEFIKAMDTYKTQQNRNFPTWREVFHVFKALGYRKDRVPRDFLKEEGLDAEDSPPR